MDVGAFVPDGTAWVHVDPARRESGRRLWRYEDFEPGPAILEPILRQAPAAAAKLAPGIDWSALPDRRERELEFINDRGTLVQTVLWCGGLCREPGAHTATRLSADPDDVLTYTAAPSDDLRVDGGPGAGRRGEAPPRRYLLVPDPALERAHLVAPRLAGAAVFELAPRLGILNADEPRRDPWFAEYEVHAMLPWREAGIRRWLADNDGGPVVVRTRDGAVPTDKAQVSLRGKGSTGYTLFGLRLGRRIACFVTTPLTSSRSCDERG